MSRSPVALGSLILISLVGVFGQDTATLGQSSPSAPTGKGIELKREPIVPSLSSITERGITLRNAVQPLDGLNCENCTFENVTFEYSGGAYRLVGCTFHGTIRVGFKGAAANTLALLAIVEATRAPKPPSGPSPGPTPRSFTASTPITADWISPQSPP